VWKERIHSESGLRCAVVIIVLPHSSKMIIIIGGLLASTLYCKKESESRRLYFGSRVSSRPVPEKMHGRGITIKKCRHFWAAPSDSGLAKCIMCCYIVVAQTDARYIEKPMQKIIAGTFMYVEFLSTNKMGVLS
jgi:hypothetical protein